MGYDWEVTIWARRGPGYGNIEDYYYDKTVYHGDNLLKAVWTFWKYRNKTGCVRLVYRGPWGGKP